MMLGSVKAPGLVGVVTRLAKTGVETLIVCEGSSSATRGFFRLSVGKTSQQPVLGSKLVTYDFMPSCNSLRPHEFRRFLACATFCRSSGLVFFNEGHNIYTMDFNNIVKPVATKSHSSGDAQAVKPVASKGCSSGDAQAIEAFSYPSELLSPEPGLLYVTDAEGLHLLHLKPAALGSGVVVVSRTTLRHHDADHLGQLSIACCPDGPVLSSATALYKAWSPDHDLSLTGSNCAELWAGEEGTQDVCDGHGQNARFYSIAGMCVDADGTVVAVDAVPNGASLVRCVSLDSHVKTIYNPSGADIYTAADSRLESSRMAPASPAWTQANGTDIYTAADSRLESSRMAPASPAWTQVNTACYDHYCDGTFEGTDVARRGPGSIRVLEDGFSGTGVASALRCPAVLSDDVLALCAPLQDSLLLLHVPGLRTPLGASCAAVGSLLARCLAVRHPVPPAGHAGDANSPGCGSLLPSSCHGANSLYPEQSCDSVGACSSSGSFSPGSFSGAYDGADTGINGGPRRRAVHRGMEEGDCCSSGVVLARGSAQESSFQVGVDNEGDGSDDDGYHHHYGGGDEECCSAEQGEFSRSYCCYDDQDQGEARDDQADQDGGDDHDGSYQDGGGYQGDSEDGGAVACVRGLEILQHLAEGRGDSEEDAGGAELKRGWDAVGQETTGDLKDHGKTLGIAVGDCKRRRRCDF